MKYLLTIGFLATTCLLSAQNGIIVTEQIVAMEGISRNSLTVFVKEANTEDIKKAWKKQLKDLKGKVNDKTFIFADDCKVKEMGDNTFDVYSVVEEATAEGVKLVVAFDLGGAYLSTANHPEKYPVGEKILRDFAVEQTKEVVRVRIAAKQAELGGFEKELAGLVSEKAALEKDIVDCQKKIEEANTNIGKNVGNQANKQKEINSMKTLLTELEVKLKAIK
jgi:hypothetical protein